MSAFNPASSAYASTTAKLLESYRAAPGTFDELTAPAGDVRDRWRSVLDGFAAMGVDSTRAAQEKARRLLLENGVTFLAQGDRGVADRAR
jgi:uncharacterized circularly permuted ATP-grasp superfamily protein